MEPSTSAKVPEQHQEEREQQFKSYPGKVNHNHYITVMSFTNKLFRSLYMVEQLRGQR